MSACPMLDSSSVWLEDACGPSVALVSRAKVVDRPYPSFVSSTSKFKVGYGEVTLSPAPYYKRLSGNMLSGFESVIHKLHSYGRLPEDWNGYGALPINSDAIADAQTFLRALPPDAYPPLSMAGTDGSIGLFWEVGTLYVSVDFEGDGKYSFIADDGPDQEGGEDLLLSDGIAQVLLSRVPRRDQEKLAA